MNNIHKKTHKRLLKKLEKYIKDKVEVKEGDRELIVEEVHLPDIPKNDEKEKQKNAKLMGVSYSKPVKATISLHEDGQKVDKSKIKILDCPQVTERGTYIVEGNEYQFPLQKRLIPGVYTQKHDDGDISSWINSETGVNYKVTLRSDKQDFILEVSNNKINLLALLRAFGYEDDDIKKRWGEDVFKKNKESRGANDPKKAIKKLYGKLRYENDPEAEGDTIEDYRDWVMEYFQDKSDLDSENVQVNLDNAHDKVSPELFLESSEKILSVLRGEEEEDNKESLIHNKVADISDFAEERMENWEYRGRVQRSLKRGLKKYDKVSKIVLKDAFQKGLDSTFTQTSLSRMPKQNNPMDEMSNFTAVTVRGEGGIESPHAVTRDVRAVDPTHLNFLDPAHTPEGQNIGTNLHMSMAAEKEGEDLVTKVRDVDNNETEKLNPREFYNSHVAFPEYFKNGEIKPDDQDDMVKVMHKGDITRVDPEKVDYAIRKATDMHDMNTTGVPFLSHNNGTRVMTASKMQAQAKPLKNREKPIVQAAVNEEGDKTVEEIMGRSSVPQAPVNGQVKSVSENKIVIEDSEGEEHEVEIAHNFWLNNNNFEEAEPVVEEGDHVQEGDQLAETNFTKDGEMALGTNLNTAYVSYKGYNHEDGVVISESAADKLTSMHAHQKEVDVLDNEEMDREKFKNYFPTKFDRNQLEKLDKDGVIKEGEEIEYGDPLVVKMREVEEDTVSEKIKNISRLLTTDYRDTSKTWKKKHKGTVEEVYKRRNSVLVVVKTEEKGKMGDKLVGRYGNKATVTKIIPDEEAPKNEDGETMDILINPNTVPSRMNVGQILETTASKVAEEDGEKYVAKPYGENATEKIKEQLEERGLEDHDTLYDPVEDEDIDGVLSGKQYFLKLEHQVDKKLSVRGAGPDERYSMSGQPASGGEGGGRAIGINVMYALLGHGADANLEEMYTFKGDKNFEAWRAIEKGDPLPPIEQPHSSRRFTSMMRGMGIDLEQKGSMVKMTPFLDRDVEDISNGEIEEATAIRAKDLKEEDGGLFDLDTTGGVIGDQWAHIELEEEMPHPTFEKSIKDVTKLKDDEYRGILTGEKGAIGQDVVDDPEKPGAKTGGEGIKEMLSSIDPEERLEEIKEIAPDKKGTPLNKLHREARILKNFEDNNVDLEEMVVNKVPVLPPKFRPIIELPNGDLNVADVNEHYRSVILMNNHLKDMKDNEGLEDEANEMREKLYDSFKGVTGFSQGTLSNEQAKGLADTIAGAEPKSGYYIKKTLKRRQETSGTAVVSPEPKLGMDEIGVPEEMAWKMFEPHIKREMKQSMGIDNIKAEEEIEERTDTAEKALQSAMEKKHVMANRAPTLHRWSIMSFKPKLVSGSAVKLPVEVLTGFNADFDGDTFGIHVPATQEANEEAEEMLPSNNLYQSGYGRDRMAPQITQEFILGLYKLTKDPESWRGKTEFESTDQAIEAFEENDDVKHNDPIEIPGIGKTTPGKCLAQSKVPEERRDYEVELDEDEIQERLKEVEKEHGKQEYLTAIEGWKDLGRKYSYVLGSSFLLSDMESVEGIDDLYEKADKKAKEIRQKSDDNEERRERLIQLYSEIDQKTLDKTQNLDKNNADKDNNISEMVNAGARGNPHQVKQMVGSLGLMLDHRQRTMEEPIRGNYSDGLESSDFWAHSYAQRKGMIDKSQSVKGPGMLSKELTNTATGTEISERDCGTDQGKREKVDRHIKNRVLQEPKAGHPKGTVIDDDVLSDLERQGVNKVKVRSILTCESNNGVCAKCFGHDENGHFPHKGKNIGVTEIQAMTERSVQLPMKSFHTAGAASAESGMSNAFEKAVQTLRMPANVTNKAVLADVSGTVNNIKDHGYGGKVVVINGQDHEVPEGRELKVEQGDYVQEGDEISKGNVKPQELLEKKDIDAVQDQMRDDLHETFQSAGVKLNKRNFETPVKMLTEKVRVKDPGDCDDYVPGDYTKKSKVEGWNKDNPNKDQIEFDHVLPGSRFTPQKSDDWSQRMALGRIKRTMREGAGQGFESDREGPKPFADLSLGPGTNMKQPGEEAKDLT